MLPVCCMLVAFSTYYVFITITYMYFSFRVRRPARGVARGAAEDCGSASRGLGHGALR